MIEVAGKLVVLGEYAVVDGSPALVQAVWPGVSCHVEPASERYVTTPMGDTRFVDAALDAVDAPPAHYVFSSRTEHLAGKPGLGGSAAATVAALLAGGGPTDPAPLTRLGIQVHRAVQGSGSGVDVAASAWGGGIRFQNGQAHPVDIPPFLAVYTGTSAKTGPRVQRYRAWSGRQRFQDETTELVEGFAEAPIPTLRAAWRLLTAMAEAAGVAYRTPAIDRIVAMAEAAGGAAKPSGAGGGDSVLVMGPDLAALEAAYRAEGFAILDVVPAPSRA